jgi:hypothetical protein
LWVKTQTAEYEGVNITNYAERFFFLLCVENRQNFLFLTFCFCSFRDGLPFLALVDKFTDGVSIMYFRCIIRIFTFYSCVFVRFNFIGRVVRGLQR